MRVLLLLSSLFFIPTCWASFDINCADNIGQLTPELQSVESEGCSEGLAGTYFLNPYNDTRINLLLLLEDLKVASFDVMPAETDVIKVSGFEIPFYYPSIFDVRHPPKPESAIVENTEENAETANFSEPKPLKNDPLIAVATALGVDAQIANSAWTAAQGYKDAQCVSNNSIAVTQFLTALKNSALSAEEKKTLAVTRLNLASVCQAPPAAPLSIVVNSAQAQEMASYLQGINGFYSGDFSIAETEFNKLLTSQNAWLKETAVYMLARTALNSADRGTKTEARLKAYLTQYPQGLYTNSAQGLFRRLYWLENNSDKLAHALMQTANSQQLTSTEQVQSFVNEVEWALLFPYTEVEGEAKTLPLVWNTPILATISVLAKMRKLEGQPAQALSVADLQAQQAGFAKANLIDLHAYLLLADSYFVQKEFLAVIKATDKQAQTINSPINNLTFSTLTLRALAFEKLQQWDKAEEIYLALFKNTQHPVQKRQLQLALALNYERSERLAQLFAVNSVVTDKRLRHFLIQRSVSAQLLETLLNADYIEAQTKAVALKTLLFKLLQHNQYAEFIRVYQKYPIDNYPSFPELQHFKWTGELPNTSEVEDSDAPYTCPALLKSVQILEKDKTEAVSLNCVGEFFRIFFYYDYGWFVSQYGNYDLNFAPHNVPPRFLGDMSDNFTGNAYTRLDYYLDVINNENAPKDARAYALYRAINCFASSGINHCGLQEIPNKQRATWFKTLKGKYKNTVWASRQKYYW